MKNLRMAAIKNLNAVWRELFKMRLISKGMAVTLTYKTTYLLGRKRKEGDKWHRIQSINMK